MALDSQKEDVNKELLGIELRAEEKVQELRVTRKSDLP